ncbi:HK97 family phage prohead protease [Micromonospora arida]
MEFEGVTFSVDNERRTMRGVVVPWNRVGSHRNGNRWRFERGALKFGHEKYVRLNNDHNQTQWFGRAIAAEDTDDGLLMTFKVKDGPAGDRILTMAKNGTKSGLSVEVEIDTADTENDPENPGTLLVKMAHLTGVGFVKEPAFTDSRLISVMASRDGGTMQCTLCGQVHADGVTACAPVTPPVQTPAPITFSADQLAWMQANGYGHAPQPPAAPVVTEPRPVITPTVATTQVTEPVSYRFDRDGKLQEAKHDFGVDVVRGWNPAFNDTAARQRVEEFIAAQFDVATGDVNELFPGQHKDRYIDQREYRYPIWNAVNRGGPPNGVEPFTWDRYNSSSGLVGPHTEGTEPTSGTFTTANQTVTPTATSGKAKITRESWEAGGRRGLSSKIWGQMVRGYFEAAEAKVVAVLDAASPTQITLTAGGGTTGQTLARELRAAMTRLHYIRGGFRFDTAFSQVDLQLALTGALDGQGRAIFPAIGPTNADGTVSNLYASVNVNGVPFLPAWSLAASGSVAASSYLIDSESVDGWITPPRQLSMPEIEVAHVYIGIWGYSAAAINDLAGVRELVYDPVA